MTTPHTIQMLTRYNAWANKAIFEAIAALPGGEATKERPMLFKNMINTLNHLHVVDLIWQAHIEGRDHGIQALNTVLYTDLTEVWRAQQAIDAWFIAWGDRLSEAAADGALHPYWREAECNAPKRNRSTCDQPHELPSRVCRRHVLSNSGTSAIDRSAGFLDDPLKM